MLMPDWVFVRAVSLVAAAAVTTMGAVATVSTQVHHQHESEKANEENPVDWNARDQKTSQRSKQRKVDDRSLVKHRELLGSTVLSLIKGLSSWQGTRSRISAAKDPDPRRHASTGISRSPLAATCGGHGAQPGSLHRHWLHDMVELDEERRGAALGHPEGRLLLPGHLTVGFADPT